MKWKTPAVVKQLPRCKGSAERKLFLSEIRSLADQCYRPKVILELPEGSRLSPETIDLLLDCIEQVERADGSVAVAAGSPEAEVILELTRLNSVVDLFPSVSAAMGNAGPRFEQFGTEAVAA